jgi:hypothetical protein
MDIANALQGLVDALQAADVEASVDPSDLNLPGVFVTLDRVTDMTMAGGGIVRARLMLLVPERDHRRSLEALQDLYAATTDVVTPMSDVEATTAALPAGHEVPGLTFTHDLPA